jgi:hypothetical protein
MEVNSVGTARAGVMESKMRRFFLLERIMVLDLVVVDDVRTVKYFAVN